MNQAELIEILVETRQAQTEALGLLVTLNFGMLGAIYYFLNHTTALLKCAAFFTYTLGVVLFGGLIWLHSQTFVGLRADLEDLLANGEAGYAAEVWIRQADQEFTMVVDAALIASGGLLWLGAAYLLFVWRCPPRP